MIIDSNLPIGVFDSGVGGLTVLHALRQVLPNESYIYLGDTARLPYGTKSPHTVSHYALQATNHLLNQGIKMLVVACNTASTHALSLLRTEYNHIPIIGVIEPGAIAACNASITGNIAVIATEGTINHQAYDKAIRYLRPEAKIISQSCSLLVAIAEEGWLNDEISEKITHRYLDPIFHNENNNKPDTLVLGCTHFPVLQQIISKVVGNDVTVVDSANTTAQETVILLKQYNLETSQSSSGRTTFLVTDSPERFIGVASRFLGYKVEPSAVELVDLYSNDGVLPSSPSELSPRISISIIPGHNPAHHDEGNNLKSKIATGNR